MARRIIIKHICKQHCMICANSGGPFCVTCLPCGFIQMRRNLNQAINNLQQAKKLAKKAARLSQGRLTEKAEDKIANSLKFIGKSFFWNQLLEKAIKRKNKRKKCKCQSKRKCKCQSKRKCKCQSKS